jgi:signal transduction histidine kinase
MARRSSVISRFRLAAVAVIVGVAVIGAVFYAVVNTHFLGLVVSRTLGPYSDSLSQVGFGSPDPDVWQKIARRHEVALVVEPPDGPREAWSPTGEPMSVESPALGLMTGATRTGPDGTRVTFYWTAISFRDSHLPLLLAFLFMVVGIVGSTFWLLQRQIRPLAWLRSGVEAVGQGDFKTRVPVVRNDEIGQAAKAFNAMAQRVGQMIDNRERLLADVSHEVRSPIARMKVALELLPPGEKRDGLMRDVREMESLISALLERQALRSKTLQPEPVDLSRLASEVVAANVGRDVDVGFEGDSTVQVAGDPDLLRLLLQNVVDNAVKFSLPDSAPVRITIAQDQGTAALRVIDDGRGIPPGKEDEVFEPFVKLDPARGHHFGYGLGLNLCQRIAELHDGAIRVSRRAPRGVEVALDLPLHD